MVYKFVVLSDEDESFVREFEFLDSQTLMDFHNIIQEELEYDKSQMASFYLATDNWEKEEEFTLFDMGTGSSTMESAILEEIIFRKNQKLLYVFDSSMTEPYSWNTQGKQKKLRTVNIRYAPIQREFLPSRLFLEPVPANCTIILSFLTMMRMRMTKLRSMNSSSMKMMKILSQILTIPKFLTRKKNNLRPPEINE
jgi:hypothetical protein